MTEEIKAVSYSIGMSLAGSLQQQNLADLSPDIMAEAIKDAFSGKELKYTPEEADGIIQSYMKEQVDSKFAVNKDAGSAFLTENAKREEIESTESGLQYEVLTAGTGDKPGPESNVTVHYHGTLLDGSVFDSSVERGDPASFGVNQVIRGWTEALQLMPKGSKYRLYIPEDLAYGASPHPGGPIQPYMALIFDVELLEIA
ncbi:MAG: FKBP-type peptidyl-prolyl cis-trans isomerase [Crocinitomicaceae bacterium]|jgi:FKBP-type peptidyl-prolyl cis-trans isomerase